MNLDNRASLNPPQVSVLIPVYNDIDRVGLCIEKLRTMNFPQNKYEIIIIDNGSSDGTYELLQNLVSELDDKAFHLIQCLKPGSYAARNEGLKLAQGEFVAFTDSDCLVSENWLQSLLDCWKAQSGSVVVAGKVSFFSDATKNTEQCALDFENMFSMKQDQNAKNGKCITANLFCTKQLLETHEGFNEKLKSGGDVEFSQRVVSAGGKIVYSEYAEVFHPSRNKKELLVKRKRVVGGTWDAELSEASLGRKLRFCVGLVKMFLGRTKKSFMNASFPFKRKVSLTWLLFLIFLTSITEFLQLQLGKEANRT